MIKKSEVLRAKQRAAQILMQVGTFLRDEEVENVEVVDFGLGELEQSGVQILTLVDTDKISVKLLVLFPGQTEPEHRHPPLGEYPGKEETIRCEWGELLLYSIGEPTNDPKGRPPAHRLSTYTVWHEYELLPGDQLTFQPDTLHWFQAGPGGAVVWSYSTKAVDVQDIFTDSEIRRDTVIEDD